MRIFYAKTYGDFKRLNDFIRASDVQIDFEQDLPAFPAKMTESGVKRSADDLQMLIEQWLYGLF